MNDVGEDRRLKVLLVAPTCNGEDVGEAWVAHQWASRLAPEHDVTLLTYHKRGATPASEQLCGLEVVEWTEPALLGRAERLNSLLKPGYLPFYVRARRWIKDALASGRTFDVVHQPVPVAMRYPCPAVGLGLRVVVGPVGGGLADPPGFPPDDTAPWFTRLRTLDQLRLAVDPLLRRTYLEAECVVGIAPYVRENLHRAAPRRFETMSDAGLEELPAASPARTGTTGPVRLLFVGRVIRTKAARDAITALSRLPHLNVVFDIVGDGPDRATCELLVQQTGQVDRIRFHGRLPRSEIEAFYRRADVFVFPSYREPGGIVVHEAMGHGLPLVVSDRGGPAASTDDACAIRVPTSSLETFTSSLADAIQRLVEDPELRRSMGAAARLRAETAGLWEARIRQMESIYSSVASPRTAGPRART